MLLGRKKQAIVDEGKALVEMYKAGFLDGYSIGRKVKSKKVFKELDKRYKLAFDKRFGKLITKELKEDKKK